MGEINDTTISYDSYHQPLTFGLLLTPDIPAILCTVIILAFYCSHWCSMMTKALRHHATFLLTIISFIYTTFDLPFSMNYFLVGYHPYRSIPFCLWWYWFDYSLLAISLSLIPTASIQRHILIFKSPWLKVRRKRWFLHYIPLVISVLCPPLFYIVLMLLYPCTVYFEKSDGWCAYYCYIDSTALYNIDWICSTVIPVFIILVANITLITRVVRSMKKIRQQQRRTWRRQKRLTLHLLAFSFVYVIVYVPTATVAILRKFIFPNWYNEIPNLYYIYHMIYFVSPLQSFLCIFTVPELVNFIKQKDCCWDPPMFLSQYFSPYRLTFELNYN